jgi:hypothetical protein
MQKVSWREENRVPSPKVYGLKLRTHFINNKTRIDNKFPRIDSSQKKFDVDIA